MAPRAMADNDAAVTSPRFTLDEAHRAAAVHDLLVYGLVGGDFGWEWEGLSRATMRTRVGGNVEQLMGSENGKGKVSTSNSHTHLSIWLTGSDENRLGAQMGHGGVSVIRVSRGFDADALPVRDSVDALLEMHDEAGPSETDVCWEWTIRK